MPAPNFELTFSAGAEALRRIEEVRQAREDRMRNALEILSEERGTYHGTLGAFGQFVRATAREGLGRDGSV